MCDAEKEAKGFEEPQETVSLGRKKILENEEIKALVYEYLDEMENSGQGLGVLGSYSPADLRRHVDENTSVGARFSLMVIEGRTIPPQVREKMEAK
jgi:hypothetical protein